MNEVNSHSVSEKNALFWDELCGSHLARCLGISDSTPLSLKKFDDWYFGFYPYLEKHIKFTDLKGKRVLEVGLGYGTVSQRLAESGAMYTGLDIAAGPVNMANHRLSQNRLEGLALQGSILAAPFPCESFDVIIAIGCLHHTGDLRQAVEQCWSLLRPGGRLTFMVYYAYSCRRWMQATADTGIYLLKELSGVRGVVNAADSSQRASYDTSASGESAPHTDWISKKSLADVCVKYSGIEMCIENIDVVPFFKGYSREQLLATRVPGVLGLDLYATATK